MGLGRRGGVAQEYRHVVPDMVVRLSGLLSRIITLSAGVGAIFPAKCQQGVRSWLVETKEPLLQDIEVFAARCTNHLQALLGMLRNLRREDDSSSGVGRCPVVILCMSGSGGVGHRKPAICLWHVANKKLCGRPKTCLWPAAGLWPAPGQRGVSVLVAWAGTGGFRRRAGFGSQ